MANQPNRHLLVYTVVNATTGRSYDMQDDPRDAIVGTLADASAKLAARQAALSAGTRSMDGFNHEIACTNFRIHSWQHSSRGLWGGAPMSGPEDDQAWIDGPGSEAR